jgi:hypothetical protein
MKQNIFNFKSLALGLCTACLALTVGCSESDYADINTDPSKVTKGDPIFLFTQAQVEYQPFDYLLWFYDGAYTSKFVQAYTPAASFNDLFNKMAELGGVGSQSIKVKLYENEINSVLSSMPADKAAQYTHLSAMANALSVYMALFDTDLFGSRPYSEAARARLDGTLTPKYDSQPQLFDQWLKELDADLEKLKVTTTQIAVGNSDLAYNGDAAKWVKFINGIKLKIAVRLLHQDKARAIKIAEEVGAADANVMKDITDDYVYNKGTGGDGGNNTYGTDNSVNLGVSSKNVIDFMRRNKDPRMLVMFTKNDFNSEVIQAFFDAQARGDNNCAIPKYVLDQVNYTTDAKGHKHFVSWKGDGEPWVRYHGLPIGIKLSDDAQYTGDNNYFVATRWKVTDGDKSKTYSPLSYFNEELVRGRVDYTFPTAPKGKVVQDVEDNPLYEMTLSAAEMNLYLAEFKLLGANLPRAAADYFKTGVEASAQAYNRMATLNKIPYYDKAHCNDPKDEPVTYDSTAIKTMMTSADYQLTGNRDADLEKVYIQLYLHFYYQPLEQFVTARRSGVPKVGSSLIPWVALKPSKDIPRRFYIAQPEPSDKMRAIIEAAMREQGFSFTDGQNPDVLNAERVWYDKGAPNFGEGPNY